MVSLNMNNQKLEKVFKQLGNKEVANHSQRFFKTGKGEYGEGDIFLGIRVPVVRKLVKEYLALPLEEIPNILQSQYHEMRLFAVILMTEKYKKADEKTKKAIYQLYISNLDFVNNWDIVDASAHKIVGPYLMNKDRKPLYKLAKSNNIWRRRVSVISTFHFIDNGQFDDALNISLLLINDTHDLIHKATGWVLREVGKKNNKVEEEFLISNYKNMPRTMLRYAIEKFPEKKRKAYLHGKV